MKEVLTLLWALVVTGLILALAYWFTRHVVGRVAGSSLVKSRRISVLEQVAVGKDQKLLLAKMGERWYFLAASPGGITILRELTEEETMAWQEPAGPQTQTPTFAQAMRQVWEQRKK